MIYKGDVFMKYYSSEKLIKKGNVCYNIIIGERDSGKKHFLKKFYKKLKR